MCINFVDSSLFNNFPFYRWVKHIYTIWNERWLSFIMVKLVWLLIYYTYVLTNTRYNKTRFMRCANDNLITNNSNYQINFLIWYRTKDTTNGRVGIIKAIMLDFSSISYFSLSRGVCMVLHSCIVVFFFFLFKCMRGSVAIKIIFI